MSDNAKCLNCANSVIRGHHLTCRAQPPRLADQDVEFPEARWPEVRDDDWCAYWTNEPKRPEVNP